MRLVLVRHAASQPDAALPASAWPLGAEGRQAAATLARSLPVPDVLLTSPLPKAAGTAAAIAAAHRVDVRVEPRLGETAGAGAWDGGHRERAARYVAGEPVEGWEPQATAAARIDAALREVADAALVVAVSHGRVLTLWLAAVGAVPDPAVFWADLRYPDAWALDADPGPEGWTIPSAPVRVAPVV
jgi:broad specificity phosphatase PhoE